MTARYWLYHAFWVGVDWLYPPVCGGCGKNGTRWCIECQLEVSKLTCQICPRCGSFEPDEIFTFRILPKLGAVSWTFAGSNHSVKIS